MSKLMHEQIANIRAMYPGTTLKEAHIIRNRVKKQMVNANITEKKYRSKAIKALLNEKRHNPFCTNTMKSLKASDTALLQEMIAKLDEITDMIYN